MSEKALVLALVIFHQLDITRADHLVCVYHFLGSCHTYIHMDRTMLGLDKNCLECITHRWVNA